MDADAAGQMQTLLVDAASAGGCKCCGQMQILHELTHHLTSLLAVVVRGGISTFAVGPGAIEGVLTVSTDAAGE